MNPTPWMTRDQLARAQGISKPTISRLASTGGSSGGWRYEARPITDADRGRLGDYNAHLQTVCRAVPVDPDLETYVLCDIVCGRLIVDWHNEDLERVRNRVRPMHGYVAGDSPPTAILKVRGEPPGEGNRIRLSDWKEDTLEVVESDRHIELPWGIHSPSETHTEKETDVSTAQKAEETQEIELDADGWTPWMTKADMVDVVNMASSAVYTAIKEGRTCGDWEFETRPVDERDEGKDLHWNVKELCRARVAEEEAEQFERAIDPRLGVEVGDIVVSLSNGHRYIVLGPNDFEGPGFDVISVEPIGPDGERLEGIMAPGEYRRVESDSNQVDKLAKALKGAMDENARLRDELAWAEARIEEFSGQTHFDGAEELAATQEALAKAEAENEHLRKRNQEILGHRERLEARCERIEKRKMELQAEVSELRNADDDHWEAAYDELRDVLVEIVPSGDVIESDDELVSALRRHVEQLDEIAAHYEAEAERERQRAKEAAKPIPWPTRVEDAAWNVVLAGLNPGGPIIDEAIYALAEALRDSHGRAA